jgi:hypothetical protein
VRREEHRTVFRWNDGEEAGHGNGISGDDEFIHGGLRDRVFPCYLVRSIWFFSVYLSVCLFVSLSICQSVYLSVCLFVILFPSVSTAELRVDDFPVDDLCGRSLYIGGVGRLDEKFKHKHFYLFSSSLPLRGYHLLS